MAGEAWGKVRALKDDRGWRIGEAGPSTPVQVGGFDGVPNAGDTFTVVDREDVARNLAEARRKIAREASAASLQVRRNGVHDMVDAHSISLLCQFINLAGGLIPCGRAIQWNLSEQTDSCCMVYGLCIIEDGMV